MRSVPMRLIVALLLFSSCLFGRLHGQTASSGRAFGESTALELTVLFSTISITGGPEPEVSGSAPPPFDLTASETPDAVSQPLTGSIFQSGTVTVQTASDVPFGSEVFAEATVEDLQIDLVELLPLFSLGADIVQSRAQVMGPCDSLTASGQTTINNGTGSGLLAGLPIPEAPAPNTVLFDVSGIRIVLNEQSLVGDGSGNLRLIVVGIHFVLENVPVAGIGSLSGEIAIAHSEAEIDVSGCSDLLLTKNDALDPVFLADLIDYALLVTNQGPDDAIDVVVIDNLPGGVLFEAALTSQGQGCQAAGSILTCQLGLIPVSQSATIQLNVRAQSIGTISNTATVGATQSDPDLNNNTASEQTVVQAPPPPEADLVVTMSDDPDPVVAEGQVTYSIVVANAGPDRAGNVLLTDSLPAGTVFVSASASQGACTLSGSTVACTLGDLDPSASASVDVVVRAPSTAGSITNSASAAADEADPNSANNSASEQTVVQSPPPLEADLAVTMSDAPDPVVAGEEVTYTITVINNGPDDATEVVLVDTLPAGTTFVSADSTQGTCVHDGGTLTCSLGTIAESQSVTILLVVRANAVGALTNRAEGATLSLDPNADNNLALVQTTVELGPIADLELAGNAQPDPAMLDENLVYTVNVQNQGPDEAVDVFLSQRLPINAGFISASPEQGLCSRFGIVLECRLGDLPPGSSIAVTIVVRPTHGVEVVSRFSVSSEQPDPEPADNDLVLSVPIGGLLSDLGITKTASLTLANPGDLVSYTLTVENFGPSEATGVIVSDSLPDGVAFSLALTSNGKCTESDGVVLCEIGSLAVGERASVVITVQAVSTGRISNLALVTSDLPDPVDCNNASGFELDVSPHPVLAAQMNDRLLSDRDGNGIPSPGDLLRFEAILSNSGSRQATSVEFILHPDHESELVVGSVSTSQGTIHLGNGPEDGSIRVGLGTIGPGASAVIEFDLLVDPTLGAEAGALNSQGIVGSAETAALLTDEPATPAIGDPTVTVLGAVPFLAATVSRLPKADDEAAEFEAAVTNLGHRTATGIRFQDSASRSLQIPGIGVHTSVDLPDLPPGQTATIRLSSPSLDAGGGPIKERSIQGLALSDDLPALLTRDAHLEVREFPTVNPVVDGAGLQAALSAHLWTDLDNDGIPTPGDTLLYRVSLLNRGNRPARAIALREQPDEASFLEPDSIRSTRGEVISGGRPADKHIAVEVDQLAAGEAMTLSYRRTLPVLLSDLQEELSTRFIVTAEGLFPLLSLGPDGEEKTRIVLGGRPRLVPKASSALLEDNDSNGIASAGDLVLMRLNLANLGTADAVGTTVELVPDPNLNPLTESLQIAPKGALQPASQSGGVQVGLGRLGMGEDTSISFKATISEASAGLPFLVTSGVVTFSAQGGGAGPTSMPVSLTTPLDGSHDLIVSQLALPLEARVGDDVTVYVRSRNTGPSTAREVDLIAGFPPGVVADVVGSLGECSQESGEVACRITELPADGVAEYEIRLKPAEAETMLNEVLVHAGPGDFDPGNSQSTIEIDVGLLELLFPFFRSSADEFTGFAVGNPSLDSVLLEVEARGSDGQLLEAPRNPASEPIEAGTQLARLGRELLVHDGQDRIEGWMRMRSGRPLASFFQFGDGLRGPMTRLDGSVAFLRSSKLLVFTRVYEGEQAFGASAAPRDARTWLSIANPHPDGIVLSMKLFDGEGLQQGPAVERSLPAFGLLFDSVGSIFGNQETLSQGFVRVDVGGPGAVGFELIELPATLLGLNAVGPAQANRLFSAQMASGEDIFTELKLVNPTDEDRIVRLIVSLEDGSSVGEPVEFVLGPQASFQRRMSDVFQLHPPQLAVGSLIVEVDGLGIIGDVIFGDPEEAAFAAALPLQAETFRKAIFSHVANTSNTASDQTRAAFTGLAFYNPNPLPTTITISVHQPNGQLTGQADLLLGPGQRASQLLSEWVPQSQGQAGGYILVESPLGIIAQELFGNLGLTFLSAVPPAALPTDDSDEPTVACRIP